MIGITTKSDTFLALSEIINLSIKWGNRCSILNYVWCILNIIQVFSSTVTMIMSITIFSITTEIDTLISSCLRQGPQFPPISISSSGKWGWSVRVPSSWSDYKEQVRVREALGIIPGPRPTEITQQMLAAMHSFMLQALDTRNALVTMLFFHFLSSPSALCPQPWHTVMKSVMRTIWRPKLAIPFLDIS